MKLDRRPERARKATPALRLTALVAWAAASALCWPGSAAAAAPAAPATTAAPWVAVLAAMLVTFAALFVAALGLTHGRPQSFLIGMDNRYSNSQVQLTLWFGALATVYGAALVLRIAYLGWDYVGGIAATPNVMALTGLSALSFGGAKVITGQKVADAAAVGQLAPKPPAAKPNLLTDLVQDDSGRADLGDFQMLLITVTAVAIFLLASFHFLMALRSENPTTLPDVDTTLLSSFGLGQGAYLLKKAASPLGQG
jgi:hypothetical protein